MTISDDELDPNLKRLQTAIREATAENTFTATEALRLDSEFTRAARTNAAGELVLDTEGFRNIMKRIGIKDAALIRGLFAQWDRDGSGELDFVEFLQSLSLVLGGSSHDKLEQLFWVMDTNGDGRVSASELHVFYTNMFRMSGTVKTAGQVQEMVRRLFAAASKDATYDTLGIEGKLPPRRPPPPPTPPLVCRIHGGCAAQPLRRRGEPAGLHAEHRTEVCPGPEGGETASCGLLPPPPCRGQHPHQHRELVAHERGRHVVSCCCSCASGGPPRSRPGRSGPPPRRGQ